MLFNSYNFIFVFLPISLIGFWLLSKSKNDFLIVNWLSIISLIFYYIWSPRFLLLLLLVMAANWLLGILISQQKSTTSQDNLEDKVSGWMSLILILGIGLNLILLGYFKYSNFLIDIVNGIGIRQGSVDNLILPLGISFYTFEQISYLVRIANGKGQPYSYSRFLLFVSFFPHLIAGPILNADELIPQFRKMNYRLDWRDLAIGFTVFAIGLFKKAVIADSVAVYATPIFNAADAGTSISFLLAWQAAIAYTLQLYFDFSGYSDMAIGLAKMFNIKLPMNFFSPYQAVSISDFWRRWHISLSRFLRDYLYIPLGGSRQGEARVYLNLLITMLLGGLWHGANWTFVLWGGLHGVYLCIDRWWQQNTQQRGLHEAVGYHYWLSRLLTFGAVLMAWVVFRSKTLAGAGRIWLGMFGGSGLVLPENLPPKLRFLTQWGIQFDNISNYGGLIGCLQLLLVLILAFFSPNLYQFMIREPVILDVYDHLTEQQPAWYAWRPTAGYALLTIMIFIIALSFCNQASEFLYFQF
jgi:alginate O-acetyltransferase complex protein AlgI